MKTSGNRAYNVWTEKEEQALRSGVKRYGVGAWEMIRQDKDFFMLKKRSGVQLKDKWRNLVKFRKLDEAELRNLPTRASGPWSRRSLRGRDAYDQIENEGGIQNCLARGLLGMSEPTRTAFPDAHLRPPVNNGRGGTQLQDSKGGCVDEAPFVRDEDTELILGTSNQRRSNRMSGRSPQLFTDYLTDFEEADTHGSSYGRSQRPGSKRSSLRLEDRRFGIYDARRYLHSVRNDTQRPLMNDTNEIATSDNDSYVVDCFCGVTYDDGQMMIECECCKAWAHVDCLKVQMDNIQGHCQHSFNAYICNKCCEQHKLCNAHEIHAQGSSISDDGLWHPLAMALVPKGKRLPRSKRSDLDDWCASLRPLYPHGFPPTGRLMGCVELQPHSGEEKIAASPRITNSHPVHHGEGGLACAFSGMNITMMAQILTQQIRHWMDSESAAQFVAALTSMNDQQRMLLPKLPFPVGVGHLTAGALTYMPNSSLPDGPPLKKPRLGNDLVDSKDFGVDGQGASSGQHTHSSFPAIATATERQKTHRGVHEWLVAQTGCPCRVDSNLEMGY